jgi:hypothetical protein
MLILNYSALPYSKVHKYSTETRWKLSDWRTDTYCTHHLLFKMNPYTTLIILLHINQILCEVWIHYNDVM